jgi:hypothetical protein
MLLRPEWSIPDLLPYSCLREDNFSSSPPLLKPLPVNAAGEAGILERAKEACLRLFGWIKALSVSIEICHSGQPVCQFAEAERPPATVQSLLG